MKPESVRDNNAMGAVDASVTFDAAMAKLSRGERFNLGLATGNTMIGLYEEQAVGHPLSPQ